MSAPAKIWLTGAGLVSDHPLTFQWDRLVEGINLSGVDRPVHLPARFGEGRWLSAPKAGIGQYTRAVGALTASACGTTRRCSLFKDHFPDFPCLLWFDTLGTSMEALAPRRRRPVQRIKGSVISLPRGWAATITPHGATCSTT